MDEMTDDRKRALATDLVFGDPSVPLSTESIFPNTSNGSATAHLPSISQSFGARLRELRMHA